MAVIAFRRPLILVLGLALSLAFAVGCKNDSSSNGGPTTAQPLKELRIGYFGNLTHAQAVLGVQSGEFASAVKPAALSTKVFNAGPSLIEALLAGEIDIAYVGPGPALNAHLKSHGEGIRILSGAAANGVLIVARKDSGINTLEDLKGKIVATPQHGNTQDIAARYYLSHTLQQADLNNVRPITNAEQVGLMNRGEIDAAWAPEPWGTRLAVEAGAKIIGEEKDLWPGKRFILTLVITTPEFLKNHPDVVKQFLAVHHQWTLRLQKDPKQYQSLLEQGLLAVNGKKLPKGVLDQALGRVEFTDDPLADTIATMGDWAHELQFAPRKANLTGLIDTSILESLKAQDVAH